MASRQSKPAAGERRGWTLNWRYAASAATLSLFVMSLFFAWQQVEHFLIHDPRFLIAAPRDYGEESPCLHLEGLRFVSRAQVLRVFQPDEGRSLYLLPLKERRKALLRIGWVKDASIQRVWPNQVTVRITEREPAAFLQVPAESMSRWTLIDGDGIILEPPEKAPFKLPVIIGVQPEDPVSLRGMRVRRMLRMLDSVGDLRDKVSEVDVADLDDLKVTVKAGGQALVLMLGDTNFGSRLRSFFDHYDEIQKRVTGATTLDLRLDDRITVIGGKRVE